MGLKVFQKQPGRAGDGGTHRAALKPPRPFTTPAPPSPHAPAAAQPDGPERPVAPRGHHFGEVAVRGQAAGGGEGLPEGLRAGVERLSGLSLGDVRVHYNSAAPARFEASAHTQGTHIHVGPGQERHLAHEAWHVVQQKQGRVRPDRRAEGGLRVIEDEGLEHEADVMGARAQGAVRATTGQKTSPGLKTTGVANNSHAPAIQFQRNRRRWTAAQREQSRKFWEKKRAKAARKWDAQVERLRLGRVKERATDVTNVGNLRVVSGPAGNTKPMGPRTQPDVQPDVNAKLGYKDVMRDVSGFLHPEHPVRSLHNEGGPQFIQQFHDTGLGKEVTRRVGVDVEPSGHVQSLRPHLNLQTQHNRVIQTEEPLADPHTPVRSAEPFENTRGKKYEKPLHKLRLTPEERRKFMERYLTSSGIRLNR